MRAQRSGERSTRRSEGEPFCSRNCAVVTLAAIMKSSMSCLARFCDSSRRSVTASPSKTARGSSVSRSSAPRSWRRCRKQLRDAVLQAQVVGEPRNGRHLGGGLGVPLEPGRDAVVGELGPVHDRGRVELPVRHLTPLVDHQLDHEGETFLTLVQRREVGRQHLGQHREGPRVRVDGRRVGHRVVVERGALLHLRVDVRDRDQDLRRTRRPAPRPRRAGRDRASRRCRSTPRAARAGRASPDRAGQRPGGRSRVSAISAAVKSGDRPLSSIAWCAMRCSSLRMDGMVRQSASSDRPSTRHSPGAEFGLATGAKA